MLHIHTLPVHQQLEQLQEAAVSLWNNQWLRAAAKTSLGGVALAVVATVIGQLAYPQSRALPQTVIGGENYGYQSSQQIAADISTRQRDKLRLMTGDQVLQYKPEQLGIAFDVAKDAGKATQYSWTERLIPFSFLWERREVSHYSIKVDEQRAKQFAASLEQYDQQPVDAEVRLEGEQVSIRKHQDGYTYNPDKIAAEVKDLKLTSDLAAVLEPEVTHPKITDAMATAAAAVAQQRLQKPIEVQAAGKSLTAEPAQIASWIEFSSNANGDELHVGYNKDKIGQWLMQLAGQVYVAAKPRTATLQDGAEVGSADGANGRALDVVATAEAVATAASSGQTKAEGTVLPVKYGVFSVRNYSRSSQGLQALLNYWDESHAGTWGVVLRTLDGNIEASTRPDHQFTSASVYKLYVAYVVYSRLDSGELKMDSPAGNGRDVGTCLDVIIIRSDNPCAEALGNLVGWSANDGMLRAKGLGSTSISYGHQLTTARDAATYLVRLQNGTLLSSGHREALLYKMQNNIHRYAIPAATPQIASANKIGYLDNFNHDVAIIYHPKGTYALAVFTQGSSHSQIRELAQQIAQVMGQ